MLLAPGDYPMLLYIWVIPSPTVAKPATSPHRGVSNRSADRPLTPGAVFFSKSVTPPPNRGKWLRWKEGNNMANLAEESIPGKVSGAWVFKDTRMPVSIVFENLEAGATIDEIMEWFPLKREQIVTVLESAARSLDPFPPQAAATSTVDAHPA
jgi:uncharacterized protein (DUF433 family)